MANYPTKWIYGTAQTVFDSAVDIGAGNFSAAGTVFTNDDAAVPNAEMADVMVEFPDWAAAPAVGAVMSLYVIAQDVDGTDDETNAPSGTDIGGGHFLCNFVLAATDSLQRRVEEIDLSRFRNGFVPYLLNGSAQNLNNDGGTNFVMKITPKSRGITV